MKPPDPAAARRFASVAQGNAPSAVRSRAVDDIKTELERPGRDPRPDFKTPELREDVTSMEDLARKFNRRGA
jgi:transcriptional accessory protein Tex/SPT6